MAKKTISICIPCFNEELNIQNAYSKINNISKKIKKYDFEIILVDNGSTDNTRKLMEKISNQDNRVICLFLSRNFGPEASGWAGLNNATGDAYIGISADLQDPPDLIPKFINEWENGYKIVLGTYERAPDNVVMRILRTTFYKVFHLLTNLNLPENTSGFGLLDKKVFFALQNLPESYRFSRGLVSWVGFKTTYILYKRNPRYSGKSSYSIANYINFSQKGLFGFSYVPLDLIVYSSLILVLLSFLFIISYLFTVIYFGNPINASIPILLAIFFFGGIILLAISILGKYIQVIVEETKARPQYIIEKIIRNKKSM